MNKLPPDSILLINHPLPFNILRFLQLFESYRPDVQLLNLSPSSSSPSPFSSDLHSFLLEKSSNFSVFIYPPRLDAFHLASGVSFSSSFLEVPHGFTSAILPISQVDYNILGSMIVAALPPLDVFDSQVIDTSASTTWQNFIHFQFWECYLRSGIYLSDLAYKRESFPHQAIEFAGDAADMLTYLAKYGPPEQPIQVPLLRAQDILSKKLQ